ncbi:MAG: TerD family protein [Moraxellaceae bacterium]|nr:TerD family protein [Moraxellaceae bacterium]
MSLEKILEDTPLLSDLGLENDLYLSLNYHNVWVDKQGWYAKWKKKQVPLDIDLACALFNRDGEQIDMIWFKNLRDKSEAICHFGDNMHGYQTQHEKEEHRAEHHSERTKVKLSKEEKQILKDNAEKSLLAPIDLETIHLNLDKLPEQVCEIALIASSYQPIAMAKVPKGEIKLQDVAGNTAIKIDLTRLDRHCCSLWIATLYKNKSLNWQLLDKQQTLVHGHLTELLKRLKLK